MQAREFDLNVLFKLVTDKNGQIRVKETNVKIDDQLEDSLDQKSNQDNEEHVMVPPLQQSIELQKASVGKDSDVISDLTQDQLKDQEDVPEENADDVQNMMAFLKNTRDV